MDETAAMAALIQETSFDDLSDVAIDRAKRAILDVAGIAVYGSDHPAGDRVQAYVDVAMPGEDAAVLGHGTASIEGAALANGTAAHALDYDDAFETIRIHPSVAIFPAALAAAEYADGDGRTLLTGYVIGVETAYRIGHSTYPSHYEHGFHSTGTIGTFGATAAVASVLGLSVAETRHAIGIAASSSSALKRNFGSLTKPLHAGYAAAAGVRAALLAESGVTANESVLSGDEGYGAVMAPEYTPSDITEREDERWAVTEIGYKLYPTRRNTHGMMEALRRLLERESLNPDEIERVSVVLDENASMVPNYPVPADEMEAKYSIEFCAAVILREGNPGLEAFTDEYVTAPETRVTIDKIESGFDTLVEEGFSPWGARVTVETADGQEFVEEERGAVGHAERVDLDRLREKFLSCAEPILGNDNASRALSALESLEKHETLSSFTDAVRIQEET